RRCGCAGIETGIETEAGAQAGVEAEAREEGGSCRETGGEENRGQAGEKGRSQDRQQEALTWIVHSGRWPSPPNRWPRKPTRSGASWRPASVPCRAWTTCSSA